MIGGSQSKGSGFRLYTGFSPVEVEAINPTVEELKKLLDRDSVPDFLINYGSVEVNKLNCKPLNFWVRELSTNTIHPMRFLVSTEEKPKSRSGNTYYINKLGQMTWGKSPQDIANNPKMSWFSTEGLRPVLYGEDVLFDFLQNLIRYSSSAEGANWCADMEANGITMSKFMQGDYSGLNKLLSFAKENNNKVGVLFEVRESVKEDSGETKQYQSIVTRANSFLRTNEEGYIRKVTVEKFKESDIGEYKISSNFYTYEFMEYDKSQCQNFEGPKEIPEEAISASKNDIPGTGDLPF